MKKRMVLVVALTCVTALITGTVVLAARGRPTLGERKLEPVGRPRAEGPGAFGQSATSLNGQASGGGCRLGVDTDAAAGIPSAEGDVVSAVQIKKTCPGVVVGQFTTETFLVEEPTGEGFLVLLAEAQCVATGGLSSPCSPGQTVAASPTEKGIVLDGDVQSHIETRGMNFVWKNLKRGVWVFYVVIFGDGANAAIGFSTFHVEAFSGGPSQPQPPPPPA